MRKLHTHSDGFTVIELLVFILVLSVVAVVAVTNIRTVRAQNRDLTSKTDINALFYQLESFHEKNGTYPSIASSATLKGIDPESLTDTRGLLPNAPGSIYTYKPADCTETKCKSFELSAELEKEAPFVKQSLSE